MGCCLERVSISSCDLGCQEHSEHRAVQPPTLYYLQPFLPLGKVTLQGLLQCRQDGTLRCGHWAQDQAGRGVTGNSCWVSRRARACSLLCLALPSLWAPHPPCAPWTHHFLETPLGTLGSCMTSWSLMKEESTVSLTQPGPVIVGRGLHQALTWENSDQPPQGQP